MKKYIILMTMLWSFTTFSMNESNNEKGSCLFDTIPDELLAYCLECGIKNCFQGDDVLVAFNSLVDFLGKSRFVCNRFYDAIDSMIYSAALQCLRREQIFCEAQEFIARMSSNPPELLNHGNLPNKLVELGATARGKAFKFWFLTFFRNSQKYGITFSDTVDILNSSIGIVIADMDKMINSDTAVKNLSLLAGLFISGGDINVVFENLKCCKVLDRWDHLDYLSHLIPIFKFYKAKIHFIDRQQNTILMLALKNKRCHLASALLKLTIDIHAKNINKMTALMQAARLGCVEPFKRLVELGADLEVRDNEDNTILMLAVYGKSLAIVKYLLSLGVDLDAINKAGKTALEIALKNRSVTIASLIAAKQASKKIKQCISM